MVLTLRKILLAVLLVCMICGPAFAFDMGLSPAKVEEAMLPGAEKTIVYSLVNGSTTQSLRIQVLVYDWKVDDYGELITPKAGTYPYSASNWVEVTPSEFVVKPRQTQLVRGTFKVPPDTKPGDYLAAIIFRQRVIVPPVKARVTGQLIPEGLIGSLTYINVPPADKKPSLESMKFLPAAEGKPPRLQFGIKNEGNTHVRPSGNIQIKDSSGNTALSKGLKHLSVVLRNSSGIRDVDLSELAPGSYEAILNLDLDPDTYKFEKGTLKFDLAAAAKAAPPSPDKADKDEAMPVTSPATKPGSKPATPAKSAAPVKPATKPATSAKPAAPAKPAAQAKPAALAAPAKPVAPASAPR